LRGRTAARHVRGGGRGRSAHGHHRDPRFAYGDLVVDGRKPQSFLAEPGARDVGVEL
jgi:L-glutamine---4-(methylsulfanyl)-2-oxobutanoate aminotransferase